jgi:hypothetical protein
VQAVDVPHEGRMDRIADQLTDALGQLVCDLGRHGEAHVLKLSHPADAVLRRNDQPRMVRAIGPATVPERSLGDCLVASLTTGSSRHANSPHPSSREGHLSTAGWISSFLLSGLILNDLHAAAVAGSRVHRNSVPSIHMRCMMMASRRASATIAFFIPRR